MSARKAPRETWDLHKTSHACLKSYCEKPSIKYVVYSVGAHFFFFGHTTCVYGVCSGGGEKVVFMVKPRNTAGHTCPSVHLRGRGRTNESEDYHRGRGDAILWRGINGKLQFTFLPVVRAQPFYASSEMNPEQVPPPNEWNTKNPWSPVHWSASFLILSSTKSTISFCRRCNGRVLFARG